MQLSDSVLYSFFVVCSLYIHTILCQVLTTSGGIPASPSTSSFANSSLPLPNPTSFCSTPPPRGPIPTPPPDYKFDIGAGPYNVEPFTLDDIQTWLKWWFIGTGVKEFSFSSAVKDIATFLNDVRNEFRIEPDYFSYGLPFGMPNAARNMLHFLRNSGTDLITKPEHLMHDLPVLDSHIRELAQQQARAHFTEAQVGDGISIPFSTEWRSYNVTKEPTTPDWGYAVGSFSYSVTGSLTSCRSSDSSYITRLDYVAHILDRYNWDKNKSTKILYFITVKDKELARLHTVGLAQEYNIRGSSDTFSLDRYDPSIDLLSLDWRPIAYVPCTDDVCP